MHELRPLPGRIAACAAALLFAGCRQIDAPIPTVRGLGTDATVQPSLQLCHTPTGSGPATQKIHVFGTGFAPQVRDATAADPAPLLPAVLLRGTSTYAVPARDEAFIDGTLLDVNLPIGDGGLAIDVYTVRVENPDGAAGELSQALRIVQCP